MSNVALVSSETPEQIIQKSVITQKTFTWIWNNVCPTVGHTGLQAFVTGVPLL
jgi:hypothetical protein